MKTPNEAPVVVITGGTAGVGRATARRFAREGYAVAVIARDPDRLQATEDELRALGVPALGIAADVADAEAVEAAATRIEDELGPIEIWVNNAMTSVFARVDDTTSEEYRRVMDVCFLGYVHGTQSALRRMRPRNRGTIMLVGSALAYRGIPLQSAYCAAKHAIQGFFDSLRSELIHDHLDIHLTMVQLPAVNTPQFEWVRSRLPERAQPVPPIYQPEVAADGIYFASQARRREVLVGAPTVQAIYGNRILPGLGDRILAREGFEGQQTGEPRPDDRPDNLYDPVPGDYAAHGRFDDEARGGSWQLEWTKSRGGLALAGLAAGVVVGSALGIARGLGSNRNSAG